MLRPLARRSPDLGQARAAVAAFVARSTGMTAGIVWQEVGDRVFRRRYPSLDLNVGLIVAEGAAAVVDTRASHHQADALREEIRLVTSAPIAMVVNTHFHWDHTFGNARFPGADIVGHVRCRHGLTVDGERQRAQALASLGEAARAEIEAVEIVPPTVTFDARLSLDLAGRDLELRHLGLGHTDSDIVVLVDGVLFAGDLIEEAAPPAFADSYPLQWPLTLARLLTLPFETVVPGHGDVVDRAFVETQRHDLAAVAAALDAALDHHVGPPRGPYPQEVMAEAWQRVAGRPPSH